MREGSSGEGGEGRGAAAVDGRGVLLSSHPASLPVGAVRARECGALLQKIGRCGRRREGQSRTGAEGSVAPPLCPSRSSSAAHLCTAQLAPLALCVHISHPGVAPSLTSTSSSPPPPHSLARPRPLLARRPAQYRTRPSSWPTLAAGESSLPVRPVSPSPPRLLAAAHLVTPLSQAGSALSSSSTSSSTRPLAT